MFGLDQRSQCVSVCGGTERSRGKSFGPGTRTLTDRGGMNFLKEQRKERYLKAWIWDLLHSGIHCECGIPF